MLWKITVIIYAIIAILYFTGRLVYYIWWNKLSSQSRISIRVNDDYPEWILAAVTIFIVLCLLCVALSVVSFVFWTLQI